jgi:O-antigen/teichoic acid export membrane protein
VRRPSVNRISIARNALARNTGWMTLAQLVRLAAQGVYFVLIARSLGAGGFGVFAAALALVSILSPFAALGTGNLLVMHVARQPHTFSRAWGNALVAIPAAGAPLTLIAVGAGWLLIPNVPTRIVLTLAVAEFFFARLAETSGQAFQGFERMVATAQIGILPTLFRLGFAVLIALSGGSSLPATWAYAYLCATVAAAAVSVVVATAVLGRPRPYRPLAPSTLGQGAYFAVAQSSSGIYTDIDKTMLASLATVQAAGIYAAAYRATAMAFAPVTAMLNAAYARFFRRGEAGIAGSRALAERLLPPAAAYGALASLALFFTAPLVPVLLGPSYAESVGALRWLAVLPAIQVWYYLAGDTLTGSGYQKLRCALQAGAAALNVLLNLWLIPRYSWQGAAWATLVSLGLLTAALWVSVAVLSRSETRKRSHDDTHPQLARVQQ